MAISKQLLEYIEKEAKLGKSKKEIKEILIAAGWHKDAISEAFDIYYKEEKETPEEPMKKEAKAEESVKVTEEPLLLEEEKLIGEPAKGLTLGEQKQGSDPYEEDLAKKETAKPEKDPENKESSQKKKRRVRHVFLYMLFLVLGMGIASVAAYFFYNQPTEQTPATQNKSGFQSQKVDDGKRIYEILKVQEALEKYYNEYKSYPEKLDSLQGLPTASTDLNYTYTPIGSPPQSYTLNIEMKNTSDSEMKISGGFMTLKNQQGAK